MNDTHRSMGFDVPNNLSCSEQTDFLAQRIHCDQHSYCDPTCSLCRRAISHQEKIADEEHAEMMRCLEEGF